MALEINTAKLSLIEELSKLGIKASLFHGLVFVAQEDVESLADKKRLLDVAHELGCSAHVWAEGVTLGPPRPVGGRKV